MAKYTVSKQTECYLDLYKRFEKLVSDIAEQVIAQYPADEVDHKFKPILDEAGMFEVELLELVKGSIKDSVSTLDFVEI